MGYTSASFDLRDRCPNADDHPDRDEGTWLATMSRIAQQQKRLSLG
jgi:hypothetical protein